MQTQLVILVGPPGTGKSHYADKQIKKNPINWVIVSRDSIRRSLGENPSHSGFNSTKEELISDIEFDMIVKALSFGFSVIADISNIKYNGQFNGIPDVICPYNVNIQIKYFICSYWLACLRDFWRWYNGGHIVGPKKIKRLFAIYDIPFDSRNI